MRQAHTQGRGNIIHDSDYQIGQNIKEGKCHIIGDEEAQNLQRHFEAAASAPGVAGGGSVSAAQAPGGIPMD